MSLIECKCPNCGGMMTVDNELEKAVCPYCGEITVIAKPITVNGTYVKSQVNNITQHIEPKHKVTANVDLTTAIEMLVCVGGALIALFLLYCMR